MRTAAEIFGYCALSYFIAQSLCSVAFLSVAWREVTRHLRRRHYDRVAGAFASPLTPAISILVPAFNEEPGIVESVRSLLGLRYPEITVIVVNDGSTDGTLQRLIEEFALKPVRREQKDGLPTERIRAVYASARTRELIVIDKENGGKADALNAGLNAVRTDYFCAVDADAVLEEDALIRVAAPILEDPERVIATGGIVRVANGCTIAAGRVTRVALPASRLAGIQIVEYIRAFLIGRVAWSRMQALLIVSGAFGLFRRDAVEEVGGYSRETIGEDMELVVRLHHHMRRERRDYRIEFVADPVCWTEAPEKMGILGRQRRRWQSGLTETLWRHRQIAGNPRFGAVGVLAFPYFILFELLGPFIELTSYFLVPVAVATGLLSLSFLIGFFVVSLLLGIVMSIAALTLEEFGFNRLRGADVGRLVRLATLETFGFRQVLAWYRALGTVDAICRTTRWGAMPRIGLGHGIEGISDRSLGPGVDLADK